MDQDLLKQKHVLLHGLVERFENDLNVEGFAQARRDLASVHNKLGIADVRVVSGGNMGGLGDILVLALFIVHTYIHAEMMKARIQGDLPRMEKLSEVHEKVMRQMAGLDHSESYSASSRYASLSSSGFWSRRSNSSDNSMRSSGEFVDIPLNSSTDTTPPARPNTPYR